MRWPGREPYDGAWHTLSPSWEEFWQNPPTGLPDVAEPAPLEQFLYRMRGDSKPPSIPVR